MAITKVPNQVMQFAGGEANLGVYNAAVDYYNHYQSMNGKTGLEYQKYTVKDGQQVELTFAKKEEEITAALKKEILRKAGIQDISQFPLETWAGHPVIRWATFAVVSAIIDMILPQTLINSIGIFTDIKSIGWGDSAAFDVKPRDLFVVSKAGRAKRTTELHKQFQGQVTVIPELREIAVSVSLYRVLSGKESLADFIAKAVLSIESQVTVDAYTAFATAMGAIDNTASTGLRVAGYSQAEFVRLSQTVRAWNGGAEPIAIGTQAALASILPADANYRYDFESEFVKVGHLKEFQMTRVMMLEQVADWNTPFGLKLADNRVWIVSPSSQKLVKLVLEGNVMSYTDEVYRNANLLQNAVIQKSWGTAVATNAVAGTIELS